MPVTTRHPLVTDYLDRLDAAAAALGPARAAELRGELEAHLSDALAAVPDDDEVRVRDVLDRLGDPVDIVAAERDDGPAARPAAATVPHAPGPAGPAPSPWGPLEVGAVALLTVGMFVLPVVGPVIGIVLAWVSQRWSRHEKLVATVWTVLPLVFLVVAAFALFFVRADEAVIQGPTVGVTP